MQKGALGTCKIINPGQPVQHVKADLCQYFLPSLSFFCMSNDQFTSWFGRLIDKPDFMDP